MVNSSAKDFFAIPGKLPTPKGIYGVIPFSLLKRLWRAAVSLAQE